MSEQENKVPTTYEGEVQLLSWSDTSVAGPKIVLALPDPGALESFKHLTLGRKAGQRFMAVFVQIGDDEKPVDPREHRPLMKSAGVLCTNEEFQRFVAAQRQEEFASHEEREEQAAQFVRVRCGVSSRTKLDADPGAKAAFQTMMAEYRQFLGKPA